MRMCFRFFDGDCYTSILVFPVENGLFKTCICYSQRECSVQRIEDEEVRKELNSDSKKVSLDAALKRVEDTFNKIKLHPMDLPIIEIKFVYVGDRMVFGLFFNGFIYKETFFHRKIVGYKFWFSLKKKGTNKIKTRNNIKVKNLSELIPEVIRLIKIWI